MLKQVGLFDPSKKKKKKKVVILDLPEEEPVEAIVEKTESLTGIHQRWSLFVHF